MFGLQGQEAGGIVHRGGRVVDRAGADDDEQAMGRVAVGDDGRGCVTGGQDGGLGPLRLRDLMLEEVWRRERIVTADFSESVTSPFQLLCRQTIFEPNLLRQSSDFCLLPTSLF